MGLNNWEFCPIVVVVSVLVSVTAGSAVAVAPRSDTQGIIDSIVSARCTVRCLALLLNRLTSVGSGNENNPVSSLQRCHLDDICSECTRPCRQPFVSVETCEDWCHSQKSITGNGGVIGARGGSGGRETEDCRESCRFVRQVNSIRPGTCPPETQATGFAALCIDSCDSDAECEADLKCCSNACGWTCQAPNHVHEGMPDIPSAPTVSHALPGNAVQLQWLPVGSNATGSVLYLVDVRSSLGRQTLEQTKSTMWQQKAQTTLTAAGVEGLRPGHWYQFRLTAVNIYGSRGPSTPTQPFALSKDPDKPGPPTNLTEGDSLIRDNKVAVTIHWSAPAISDLPISRYKIYWSKRLKVVSPQFHSMQEFRQVLSAERHSYRLMDLDPDATYFVQVQAISHHGDVRLKSEKASLYITTYPLPRSSGRVFLSTSLATVVTARPLPTPPTPDHLTIIETYYQNGLLKANISWSFEEVGGRDDRADKLLVYWSTEGCSSDLTLEEPPVMSATTHVNYFTIYDLRFNCRYLIRVQSVTVHGVTGSMAYCFLDTPPCGQALVIGEVQPDCPRTSGQVPGAPTELRYEFIVSSSNVSVRLGWSYPSVPSVPPVTGYHVLWSLVMSGSHHLLLDKTNADQRNVPKDVQALVLMNLHESSTYAVCVQAMSRAGRGRVMSIRFTTPTLQPPVVFDPPYVDVGSQGGGGRVDSVRQNSIRKKPPDLLVSYDLTTTHPPIVWTYRDYSRPPVKHVLDPSKAVSSSSHPLSVTDVSLLSCLYLSLQRLFSSL